MNDDYRYTVFDEEKSDFIQKKEDLRKLISEKSRHRNMYNAISRKVEFANHFKDVYDEKCCYCGVSIDIVGIDNFEIDHVICQSFCDSNNIEKNELKNLAFCCKNCNRNKGDIVIMGDFFEYLSPDHRISEAFYRDENYNICIREEVLSNQEIIDYYKKMRLSNQSKRLDYLLLVMEGFIRKNETNTDVRLIKSILSDIVKIRNRLYKKLIV